MDLNNMNLVQIGLLVAAVNDYLPKLKTESLDFKDLSDLRKDLISKYQSEHTNCTN